MTMSTAISLTSVLTSAAADSDVRFVLHCTEQRCKLNLTTRAQFLEFVDSIPKATAVQQFIVSENGPLGTSASNQPTADTGRDHQPGGFSTWQLDDSSAVKRHNNFLDKASSEYNKIKEKECFIIRPRKEGLLQKQTGFGRKVVLKITYDPRNDEPSIRHSKERLGSEKRAEVKMQNLNKFELLKDTRRYFKLQIWKIQPSGHQPLFFRCQYLLPIFFHPQLTNTEVFVYPAMSITFNRNQGNQFSYWKNNFFIINNASQSVHFKILTTRLPNNCDMVIFPTSGVVQHSFSDYTLQKRPTTKAMAQSETDQDVSGKHYTIVSILLLDPEKAYMTHMAQKPIATIVMLYSYQKHPETDNLDELLQWATGKETIEIFVRDMSNIVAAKNTVVHDKKILEMAMQNSMDQVYKMENVMSQSSSRLARNTLSSQKHSRSHALGSWALFTSSLQGYGSTVMANGNPKDLQSFSSLPDLEPRDEVTEVQMLPISASSPHSSATASRSTDRSQEVSDVVKRVKARISNERRITVTYGVSDSDIRQLIDQLQLRGCDASESF